MERIVLKNDDDSDDSDVRYAAVDTTNDNDTATTTSGGNTSLSRQLKNTQLIQKYEYKWCCPNCNTHFGRSSMIRGLPAIKLVGGKTRMTKK